MKRLFTLLTLLVCVIGSVWAEGEVFTLSLNEAATQTRSDGESGDFFTVVSGGGFNAKYTGTYNGVNYKKGLKLNSASSVTFTTTSEAKIVVVQSLASNGTYAMGMDGTAFVVADRVDDTDNTVGVYTLTGVEAGTHTIDYTPNKKETGLLYVSVEYTGSIMTLLSDPVISFSDGSVSISQKENADVYYTIDGTIPSVETGIKYEEPFAVEDDGTVVKAIAIGDGESVINSAVSEEIILLTGIQIATPVVKSYNGTVAITCENPKALIEYSIDGGNNYLAYIRPFTLDAQSNIALMVRASREGCTTSDLGTETVSCVPASVKTKTIYMGYGSFDAPGEIDGLSTLNGKAGDAAEGYSLILNTSGKNWSTGSVLLAMSEGESRTAIKLSNGAQNILRLPAGVKATKLTLYSVINAASGSRTSGWREINGENMASVVTDVPMGAFNDVADRTSNPDVRVFPLDNVEGEITFTNTGEQLLFVIALDVIEPVAPVTLNAYGYSTYSNANTVTIDGAVAYTATVDEEASVLRLTEIGNIIPAGEGVLLKGDAQAEVTISVGGEAPAIERNDFVAAVTDTPKKGNVYVLSGSSFVRFLGETLPQNKAYIVMSDSFGQESNAKPMSIVFGDGGTTGITVVGTAAERNDAPMYNLNGQRVAPGTKGLLIQNGKKVIVK